MTFGRLLRRNLRFHWRGNLAVLLGVVVGTAVLTGALFVGDSLRGSLRDLAGEQLAWVEHALVGRHFFRESVPGYLAGQASARERSTQDRGPLLPAILLQGTAGRKVEPPAPGEPGPPQRVGQVMIWGVGTDFWYDPPKPVKRRFGDRVRRLFGSSSDREVEVFLNGGLYHAGSSQNDELVLNDALARELGVDVGDSVTLSVQKVSQAPRESLLGRREAGDVVDELTLKVKEVLPADGLLGRFNLSPSPAPPRNAFVSLHTLQKKLGQPQRANVILAGRGWSNLQEHLSKVLILDDWGLQLQTPISRTNALLVKLDRNRDLRLTRGEWRRGVSEAFAQELDQDQDGELTAAEILAYYEKRRAYLSLESRTMFLEPAAVDAALAAAKDTGLRAAPTLVYLANRISDGQADIPYSVVAALDPAQAAPLGPFLPAGAGPLGDDEILLADWKESPLRAKPGDSITLTYFLPDERGGLREAETTFRLRGFVPLEGPAADPDLTPAFPGITDELDIKKWNPPFPYDNRRVKKEDEHFWEQHRTTPKAYVTFRKGAELWGGRFGNVTSVRLAPPAGTDLAEAAHLFERRLLERFKPEQGGLVFDAVRQRSLEAGPGGLDFGGLFLGFSAFLIAAALLLVGLLFRLNLDRRAGEIGLLVATGYRRSTVRNLLLAEGGVLALVGAALGCAAAVGYAWLLLEFLRAWWPGGLEGSFLRLHVSATSLAAGYAGAVFVSVLTIAWAVRILSKLAPSALLAGQTAPASEAAEANEPGRSTWVAVGGGILGVGLLVAGNWVRDHEAQAGTFFGGGALLLTAGLAAVLTWMRREDRRTVQGQGAPALGRLGRRNAARHRTRSLLTAGLLASAAFLVVAVESFRRDPGRDYLRKDAGSGGYALYAESALPIFQDLNTEEGRAELNFPARSKQELQEVEVKALRLRAGDDASCLNLVNPSRPRLLGVPAGMIREGGFRFADTEAKTSEECGNPWLLLEKPRDDNAIPVFGEKNSVSWMLKSGLGGEVEAQNERGEPVKLRVVGLLQDSVFQNGLLLSEANFLKLYPGHAGYHVFLVRTPAERTDAVKALLEGVLGPQGFEATRSTDRLAMYLAVENTYLSTFQMLGGLGLLLGALGLAVVLLRGVWERRGELALLRALGFRPGALGWLVLAENGFLLALGLGVGAASALLAVLPHAAGGGDIPWLRLTVLLALVVVVGLAAGAAAVAASLRAPLVPALRRE